MYLIFYVITTWIRFFFSRKSFSNSTLVQCFEEYRKVPKTQKKNFGKVFREVNGLCKYWHCFPDTYFILCHFLKEYNGEDFLRSFLPQNSYGRICAGGVENTDYKVIINDKVLFNDYLKLYALPVPDILVVYKNYHWFIDRKVATAEQVDYFLNGYEEDRIFVKLVTAGAATGVFVMKKLRGKWVIDGNAITAELLVEKYGYSSFFLERQLKQENVLASYNPDTVNTIRVLTLNTGKELKIASAAVRFGRKGSFVDNMHAGGLAVSIDKDSGKMETYGCRRFDTTKYYEHPDSHLSFEGVEVPQWEMIKDLVYKTLLLLPQYRSVGFDIVTTDKGPLILEINTGAGMDLAQVGKKQGIAIEFADFLNLARKIR